VTLEHDHATHEHGEASGHDHSGHAEHEHDHGEHAGHEHVSYPEAVIAYRADKDEYYRDAHDSPIPHDQRETFMGLPYFPVDESLRFEGLTLEPYTGTEPTSFQIPTSDGKLRPRSAPASFGSGLPAGSKP